MYLILTQISVSLINCFSPKESCWSIFADLHFLVSTLTIKVPSGKWTYVLFWMFLWEQNVVERGENKVGSYFINLWPLRVFPKQPICSSLTFGSWSIFTSFWNYLSCTHCISKKTLLKSKHKISWSCLTLNRLWWLCEHSCWAEFLFHNWKCLTQY